MSDDCTIALSATTIHTTTLGRVSLVSVTGDIDLASGGPLRAVLAARLDQHPAGLVVDLTRTAFFSAAGIEALVETAARAQHVPVVVVADHRTVLRPLEITGADRKLRLESTVDRALSALASGRVPDAVEPLGHVTRDRGATRV